MAIKCETVAECLEWSGCDIDTLLYTIALDGADSSSEWENRILIELIKSASEAIVEAEDEQKDTIALDLESALEKIHWAMFIFERRKKRRAKKSESPQLVVSNS